MKAMSYSYDLKCKIVSKSRTCLSFNKCLNSNRKVLKKQGQLRAILSKLFGKIKKQNIQSRIKRKVLSEKYFHSSMSVLCL